ncbi:MAG: anthrone oxygenase family protein [Myxococcota bacterium]
MTAMIWAGIVGSALMAGTFFTFSAFVMQSLAALPAAEGIRAMQSINRVILSSLFMPIFMGTSLMAAVLAGQAIIAWRADVSGLLLTGGLLIVAGMFVCTGIGNVPLNNALDVVDANSAEGARVWAHYLDRWTLLNHVRTVACTAGCALFVAALVRWTSS